MPKASTASKFPPFSKGRVFRVVVWMMIAAGAAIAALAIWGSETDMHRQAFSLCSDFLKAGSGALLVMIGTRGR
jgi:hypothetical protein